MPSLNSVIAVSRAATTDGKESVLAFSLVTIDIHLSCPYTVALKPSFLR